MPKLASNKIANRTVKIELTVKFLAYAILAAVILLTLWEIRETVVSIAMLVFVAFILNAGLRPLVAMLAEANYKSLLLFPFYVVGKASVLLASIFGQGDEAYSLLKEARVNLSKSWRQQVDEEKDIIAKLLDTLLSAKLGRGIAITVVYVGVLTAIVFLFYVLTNEFVMQVTRLVEELPNIAEGVINFLYRNFPFLSDLAPLPKDEAGNLIDISQYLNQQLTLTNPSTGQTLGQSGNLVQEILNVLPDLLSGLEEQLTSLTGYTFSLVGDVASFALNLVTILILSIYMLQSPDPVYETALKSFNAKTAKRFRGLLSKIEHKLGAWLGGQLLLMFIIGFITYLIVILPGFFFEGYRLDEFALPIALLAGLLESLPNIGPIITAVITSILAVGTSGLGGVIYVLVTFLMLQQLEGALIVPQIMKRAIGVDPIISILAVIAGFQIGDVIGALLAIPLAGIVLIIFHEVMNEYKSTQRLL